MVPEPRLISPSSTRDAVFQLATALRSCPLTKAMPVIVHEEEYDQWLDGEVESAYALAAPFPS